MDNSSNATTATPRKKMPAEVFVKIWTGEKDVIGPAWQNRVTFKEYENGAEEINFSNIEVVGRVYLEKNGIKLPSLVLHNCQLENFEFKNANIQAVEIKKQSKIGTIYIIDSTTGSLTIENSSMTGNFVIVSSQMRDFKIENSIIKDFSLNNSEVRNFWLLKNSIAENITINSSTTGNFEIRENSIMERFSILKKSIIGDCKIVNSSATILTVQEESRLSKIRVWHSRLQRIEIKSNSFILQFKCQLNLHEPAHIVFEQSCLGHLNFNNSVYPEFTTLKISDCQINQLQLSNFCNYGTVFFSRLLPLTKWEAFKKDEQGIPIYKEGVLQPEPQSGNSILRLTDSDLGKMQFINCDLRKFDRFEFSNTKMLDVFVAGSQMPDDSAFCLPDNEQNPQEIAEQKRLAYGQFKKIYESQGDIAGSLRYLAYEMDAYLNELNSKPHQSNRGERWMLRLNKYSTNYGNDWLLGAKRTFWAVLICYSTFCLLQGFMFNLELKSWENFKEFVRIVSYAPYYLNPLRDLDSVSPVDEKEINSLARIWDFISRIIVAYFAYQTIQAFRKLGKSSG